MKCKIPFARKIVMCLVAVFLVSHLSAQDVLTWHNDAARTGQYLIETLLSPSNVNSTNFGLIFSLPVDGKVDAQPLYASSLTIAGAPHNVVYVATENDTVYAFDADTGGPPLWSASVLASGESASDNRGCNSISPTIGILATPAIDLASGPNGTIYLAAMSVDGSGNHYQTVHALDLTTGAEQSGWPVTVQATYPGHGPNSSGGLLTFDPQQYMERAALLMSNGVVYPTWASHCDNDPYNGWVIGYKETTGAQTVLNLTPNGSNPQRGAIWMSGAGPAADAGGNIYFLIGNGTFDTSLNANGFPSGGDYGNAFMNLSTTSGLGVADYFTMDGTLAESAHDEDLGSGGGMLLPILNDAMGNPHELAVGAGKDGIAYVVDRNNMGKFNMNSNAVYQEVMLGNPVFSSPAWFNNTLYYGTIGSPIAAYTFLDGSFNASSPPNASHSFGVGCSNTGATPSISANGSQFGIVWASDTPCQNGGHRAAVLYAFDAGTLNKLYDSTQNTSENFGIGTTFPSLAVANGKVYVGTSTGVAVFGLLNCSYDSNQTATSSTTFTINVSAAAGCSWSAASNSSFISILGNSSGNGNGSVNFVLAPYAGASGTGIVIVAGQRYTIINAVSVTPGPSISAVAGTPQSTTVGTEFPTALQAKVLDSGGNPVIGIAVVFNAPGGNAGASFSGSTTEGMAVQSDTVLTESRGIATSAALIAGVQQGAYTVTAATEGAATTASFRLTNNPVSTAGTLSGLGNSAATPANLTAEGPADWVHWGDGVLNRKSGVTAQIGNYTEVGSGPVLAYNNDPRALSWTDGTPTATGSNYNGVYISSLQNGFSITAPADTSTRILTVHVGGWLSGGTLVAALSDGSATAFVDKTTTASGQYDRNYTLTYSAASPGQTLNVSWTATSGTGNVTLNGAALSVAGPSVSATAGSPQSAPVSLAFATVLQATVKDANNNPLSGVAVTFTAPSTGPSATFSGSATATVMTNSSGVATAPTLTANAKTGSYTISATITGVSIPANFSLTNLAGPPSVISATAGTPQSASVNSGFATALQATVTDANGNPLSGVMVTFAAPATGATATFGGLATATANTNSSGIATAPMPIANGQIGSYTVTASVTGVSASASYALTNTTLQSNAAKLVQQAAGSNGGNNHNTLTVALGNAPGSGNILVLVFGQVGSSQTITSITGATWTRIDQNYSGNVGDSEIWVGTNPSSSQITITGANYFGTFQPGYAVVAEFSGIATTLDGSAINATSGNWPVTTGKLGTSNAADLLITTSLAFSGGGASATVGGPWTLLTAPPGTHSLAGAYQIVNARSSYSAAWNGFGTPKVSSIILALR